MTFATKHLTLQQFAFRSEFLTFAPNLSNFKTVFLGTDFPSKIFCVSDSNGCWRSTINILCTSINFPEPSFLKTPVIIFCNIILLTKGTLKRHQSCNWKLKSFCNKSYVKVIAIPSCFIVIQIVFILEKKSLSFTFCSHI